MKKGLLLRLLATLALCASCPLMAEVQSVKIKWTPSLCRLDSCIKGLENQFRRIKGVSDVQMDQQNGQAVLQWRSDVQFSYPPVYQAMAMIGLSVDDFRIRVRGRVIQTGSDFYLVSIGDETRFKLFGPIQTQPLQQTPETNWPSQPKPFLQSAEYNVLAHPLTLDLQDRLKKAQGDKRVVTIDGPLLMPERSPPDPLSLIIEHLNETPAPAPQ